MSLKDYRQKFPEYDDISDYDLTSALHKKYGQDMDFGEFAKQIQYGTFGEEDRHERLMLEQKRGPAQGMMERGFRKALEVYPDMYPESQSMGGQIRTGLEKVGTPYIPGMLTEAESARPPMPLQPAHETPLPYPNTLQQAHEPPNIGLEQLAAEASQIQQEEGPAPLTPQDINLPGVLAPLAVAGPAWIASKIGKYSQYLPEHGTGEDAVDLHDVLAGTAPVDTRTLRQREAQGKEIEEAIMSIPGLFAVEPQEQRVLETVAKPFEYLDTALSRAVEPLPEGLREPVKDFAELLILIKGPRVAKGAINKIKNSNAFRMATVKERGLMVQNLAETLKKNPNISEGELIRRSQQYKREAKQPRGEGEMTAEEFLAERERVVGERPEPEAIRPERTAETEPEAVIPSDFYLRKNNLAEAAKKLRKLKEGGEKYISYQGEKAPMPKEYLDTVDDAIRAIETVTAKEPVSPTAETPPVSEKPITEAPVEAAPEPDQVTPFPGQRPELPTPKVEETPTKPVEKEPWEMTEDEYIDHVISQRPSTPSRESNYKYMVEQIRKSYIKLKLKKAAEDLSKKWAEEDKTIQTGAGAAKERFKKKLAKEKDLDVGEGEPPLPPKEQKKWLLSEVDSAIKEAGTKQAKEDPGTIPFHVPGDGEFTILNTKESLRDFRKRAEKAFPDKIRKPIIIRKPAKKPAPSKTRLSGEGVEYYNEFQPRKVSPLIELKDRNRYYTQGYYSDGAYIIKTPKSKVKKEVKDEAKDLKNILSAGEKAKPALIVGEVKTEYGEEPYAHVMTVDEKYHATFDPKYIDNILTNFPDAKPFMKADEPMLYFKVGDEVVGAIAGFRGREGTISDVLDTPEFGARYLKIYPESKLAKEIGEMKRPDQKYPPKLVMIKRILSETTDEYLSKKILEGMDKEKLVELYVKDWRKDQPTPTGQASVGKFAKTPMGMVKQQVEVDGEIITIEKPAAKRMKEIDDDISAHKQLLDCIKALGK